MTNNIARRFATYLFLIFMLFSCEGIIDDSSLTLPTCEDGVKNQGERGIDCGGPCLACDANPDNYYRLESFMINVIPEKREVSVLFQVLNRLKDGVPDLSKSDFIITENNNPTTESISDIDPETIPFTYRTVLLLDISSSIKDNVADIKQAANALINAFSDNQEIAIYTFDSSTKLLVGFTSDKSKLTEAINSLSGENLDNSTNLYDAIIAVSDLWQEHYSIDSIVDGSLIVFTDGRHTAGGSTTVTNVIAALGDENRESTYIAAVNSSDLDADVLKDIVGSEERYLEAQNFGELKDKFLTIRTRIENLARSFYLLKYKSPISQPDDVNNTLKIEIEGNINIESDKEIIEQFNSKGFMPN